MNVRNNKAITLIALVVTIVVLLILAGVSISMLSGDNGIITKAEQAKNDNEVAEIEEQVALAVMAAKSASTTGDINYERLKEELKEIEGYSGDDINEGDLPRTVTVTISGVTVTIDENGTTAIAGSGSENDPKTLAESKENELDVSKNTTFEDTNGDKITIPAGFNVDKDSPITVEEGIVVEDKYDNQYVWIPVFEKSNDRPWGVDYSAVATAKTAEKTSFTATDYTNIKAALKTYTVTYANNSYSDEWFGDSTNATDGYYSKDDTAQENLIYYKNGNLEKEEYNQLYNNMLVSVYKNGGFYIGRYEMGTGVATSVETAEELTRESMSEYISTGPNARNEAPSIEGMVTPISKINAVGYMCITQDQAQMLAEKMGEEYGYGDTTSSLMFGIQWDAVCVFLEKYGKLSDGTTAFDSSYLTDSTKGELWGNYSNKGFMMDRGYHNDYYDVRSEFYGWEDKSSGYILGDLCTTGVSDRNCALNIYDFGGNLYEMTLEKYSGYNGQIAVRGGCFNAYSGCYASVRSNGSSYYDKYWYGSARPSLYL